MIDKLNRVKLTKDRYQLIKNQLGNLYTMRQKLRDMTRPSECVELLYVELLVHNRLSYVQRILGRYHKLTRVYELEKLHQWTMEVKHGTSKTGQ